MLGQVVAMFPNVVHLSVHGDHVESWKMEGSEWLPFFCLFHAAESLHLSGGIATHIASALEATAEEMITDVFPALRLIWLDEENNEDCDEPVGPIVRFLSLRQLSGLPVAVVDDERKFRKKKKTLTRKRTRNSSKTIFT
jgi:hypothetical protein